MRLFKDREVEERRCFNEEAVDERFPPMDEDAGEGRRGRRGKDGKERKERVGEEKG